MEENGYKPYITGIQDNGCLTVVTMNEDGSLNYISLVPGQFDKAKRLLSPSLRQQVEDLWTEDAIYDYRQSLQDDTNDTV